MFDIEKAREKKERSKINEGRKLYFTYVESLAV